MQLKMYQRLNDGKITLDLNLDFTFASDSGLANRIQVENDSLPDALKRLAFRLEWAESRIVKFNDLANEFSKMAESLRHSDFVADLERAFFVEPVFRPTTSQTVWAQRCGRVQRDAGIKYPEIGKIVNFVSNQMCETSTLPKVIPAMITKITGDTVSLAIFEENRTVCTQWKIKYNSDAKVPYTWHWPNK